MRRVPVAAVVVGFALLAIASVGAAEPKLPAQVDGFILAPVDDALAKQITDAQDGKEVALTIAIDGAKPEALAVAPERLRDYQNVYFRVVGSPGSWRLEENGFSPSGADEESRLIRRALGVGDDKKVFFLPGREHLLVPAKSQVVLRAGGQTWSFQGAGVLAQRKPTRAVVIHQNQGIPLALSEALNSATIRAGGVVALTVARDVVADGLVAIPKGTSAEARVVRVRRPSFPGNPGRVVLELSPVAATDGTTVPLRAASGARLVLEGQRGFLLGAGRHVDIPAGARIAARAARNVVVLAPK